MEDPSDLPLGSSPAAEFSALIRTALDAGRHGFKWKPVEEYLATQLGVDKAEIGAAGTNDFKKEFRRLQAQAPTNATALGLVALGTSADLETANERIATAIEEGTWRPTAPIAVCADSGEGHLIQSVIGRTSVELLEQLRSVSGDDAVAVSVDPQPTNTETTSSSSTPQLDSETTLQTGLQRVLELQDDYSSTSTEPMHERGLLIRAEIPSLVQPWIEAQGLEVEGRDATGRKSKVPWVRVFDEDLSPSARIGWYVVYLFARDGSTVNLSLNRGTTDMNGSNFKTKDLAGVRATAEAARRQLTVAGYVESDEGKSIDLADPRGLAEGYEAANVYAVTYDRGAIPSDQVLQEDLERLLEMLRHISGLEVDLQYPERSSKPEAPKLEDEALAPAFGPPDASADFAWLVSETLWVDAQLRELIETLSDRTPQVILAGPPGTGKTWVAEKLALHMTSGRAGAVSVVQFHPTYAYEDFVQGLRPVAGDRGIEFQVRDGPLVALADAARAVDHPVVLVIDEINRANLASVFGELMYLLDKRDKEIRLLHGRSFSIPKNLFVVGTMNTADRSIRSIDIALRRRFEIFECFPSSSLIDRYYADTDRRNDVVDLAGGLDRLNGRLEEYLDKHHQIGHTFFMRPEFDSRELQRTWQRQIYPLLEEYLFDQADVVTDLRLEDFWPQ